MSDLTRIVIGWVAYIIAIAILGIWLTEVARADMLIKTERAPFAWDPALPSGAYYQLERSDGTQNAQPGMLSMEVPPLDRTATTELRVRVRTCIDAFNCGAWSEWSDPVLGVPLGFDIDVDGDGDFDNTDFPLLNALVMQILREGHTWPR